MALHLPASGQGHTRSPLALDVPTGAAALEQLIDLAREIKGYDLFHSEDPVEAAGFVVSDAAAALWQGLRDHHGFTGFARLAAPQLIRWEREHGWTRSGWGRLSEKETTLATVLAGMLRGHDAWADFADHYLTALDQTRTAAPRIYGVNADYSRRERTGDLADWHLLLLERLEGTDADHLLDRLVTHPQLTGPELTYLQAHRAIQTGAPDKARALMRDCLKTLPGHEGLPRVREKDQHPVKPTHVAGAQLSGRPTTAASQQASAAGRRSAAPSVTSAWTGARSAAVSARGLP